MHHSPSPDDADLHRALQQFFGHAAFRPLQQVVVRLFLGGGSALVLMATGDGKSLCYQLPAMVGDGLTLVVSPLIALMEDQVAALRHKDLPATCIHSQLDADERQARLQAAERGDLRLLYVTPERFRVPGFLDRIRRANVTRLAIDEAHCLSQWGHDFRPDYKKLGEVRQALGTPPCLALTATATPAVQRDIRDTLGLGDAPLFHRGIERDNLFLSVQVVDDDAQKLDRLLAVLDRTGGPAIVYCALIRDLLALEGELQRRGMRPLVYHGDLSAHERKTQQQRFQQSVDALILATNAFGMGVDKHDIRAIVHWQIPRTLEAYYQEVGRAGRDGQGSFCELLYRGEDLQIQRDFTEWANPEAAFVLQLATHLQGLGERLHAEDLDSLRDTFVTKNKHDGRIATALRLLRSMGCVTGEAGKDLGFVRLPTGDELRDWLPADKRQHDLMALLRMVRYATEPECRKRTIAAHFGFDAHEDGCGACDICTATEGWQATHLPPTRRIPRDGPATRTPHGVADTTDAAVQRGDWIDVQGLGLCHVLRVHRRGRSIVADVEVASDLARHSVDLQRRRWRRVRHDG